MAKKYLKTVEEIWALKGTDTKIYKENNKGYYQFVSGVPCFFGHDFTVFYNSTIDFDQVESKLYILVDEPVKDATEEDIGKLCWFWDCGTPHCHVLKWITKESVYPFCDDSDGIWKHCRRLTPAEVAEITGYKVEE